jgi:prepilin-type N-terminal cleavage/methylation domain-containing protein
MVLTAIRKKLRHQGGFTLIELLVVITVLGILAAIVSISLLGVTAAARDKAKKAEFQTVQAAFDAMLADQQIAANGSSPTATLTTACTTDRAGAAAGPTNNMKHFPPGGLDYTGPADPVSGGQITVLATHYLREGSTAYQYTCDGFGTITQQ